MIDNILWWTGFLTAALGSVGVLFAMLCWSLANVEEWILEIRSIMTVAEWKDAWEREQRRLRGRKNDEGQVLDAVQTGQDEGGDA